MSRYHESRRKPPMISNRQMNKLTFRTFRCLFRSGCVGPSEKNDVPCGVRYSTLVVNPRNDRKITSKLLLIKPLCRSFGPFSSSCDRVLLTDGHCGKSQRRMNEGPLFSRRPPPAPSDSRGSLPATAISTQAHPGAAPRPLFFPVE